jgi:hypothetical protein
MWKTSSSIVLWLCPFQSVQTSFPGSRSSHLHACTSMEHGPSIIRTHSTQDVTHTLGQVDVAKI